MSEAVTIIDLPVPANFPCPECGRDMWDYKREDDPFYWCLGWSEEKPCNTFKAPKENKNCH